MSNIHQLAWAARQANISAFCNSFGFHARAGDDDDERIADIRAQQDRLLARSQDILNAADSAGRELTDDERRAVKRRADQVERLEEEIQGINARLSQPQPRATSADASDAPGGSLRTRPRAMQPLSGSARMADLFGPLTDPYAGRFSSLGDFGLAVTAGNDSRLIRTPAVQAAAMGESSGVGGGFLVPPQFVADVLDGALESELIRPRAMVLPMQGKSLNAAAFDYQDATGGASAGLTLRWSAESSSLAEQTGKARDVLLNARKGTIFVRVSNELANDGRAFDMQLRTAMRGAVAAGLDYAFLQGTGVAQPLGVLNAPGTITVSKESGQASSTLMLQNLAKMLARLRPGSYRRSVWMVHQTLLPLLYQMAIVIKNVAGTENVGGGSAAVTIDADGNVRIFGRPVFVSDACSALSSLGDIVLADWTGYLIGLRQDVSIARDDSRYFDTDESAFRMILRLDGQPMNSAPVKLRDGTNTVSHFVTLEAR